MVSRTRSLLRPKALHLLSRTGCGDLGQILASPPRNFAGAWPHPPCGCASLGRIRGLRFSEIEPRCHDRLETLVDEAMVNGHCRFPAPFWFDAVSATQPRRATNTTNFLFSTEDLIHPANLAVRDRISFSAI